MKLTCRKSPRIASAFVIVFLLVFFACGSLAGPAVAAGLELSKRAAGHEFTIRLDRNPPVLGKCGLEVEIRGPDGQIVSGAAVAVNYYMPPMPRMAPMNYKIAAAYQGGKYRAVLHFIMEGPWVIAVRATRDGRTVVAKFNIDVR